MSDRDRSSPPPAEASAFPDAAALDAALRAWDDRGWPRPGALLVSGSGLAVDLYPATHGPVPLEELLPFPVHGIQGHPHRVELFETPAGETVLYLRGRLHSYQGYSAHETVFPVRLAALLGARRLLMTNAAGGLDPAMAAGDLALVTDHLNLTGLNPLRGDLPPVWGARFPDMGEAYSKRLRALVRGHAEALGIELGDGVYAGVAGPSYETPAEVRMLSTLGAHLVGMSTVLEVITARHMGLECLVLSLVANPAAGVVDEVLDHEDVVAAAAGAARKVQALLRAVLADPGL